MRKIAVILGSKSDLRQCLDGLKFLKEHEGQEIECTGVYIASQHRNTLYVQMLLSELVKTKVDAIIVFAGWANHLTGCCDAFLRYTLHDSKIVVIGGGLEDENNPQHTLAAKISITEVPGTQVVHADEGGFFGGSTGFLRACRFAVLRSLPTIKLPDKKETNHLVLAEAIKIAAQ